MKKILSLVLCLILVMPCAFAEIELGSSPVVNAGSIAAGEYSAKSAYFSPYEEAIYYIAQTDSGYDVIVFDAASSTYSTVHSFTPDADYISISADSEGCIYLLMQDRDETSKSGILRLVKEETGYVVTDYLFPAASAELIPVGFEFSPYSSTGYVLMWLNNAGEYVSAMSVFSMFWGALQGYDELIAIEPGTLSAEVFPMIDFYDVYGYQTAQAQEFLNRITSGELLSPTSASLSPSGNILLLTVPFEGSTVVYAMDVYTYALQMVYPPDGFSGVITWTEDDTILLESDDGTTETISLEPFESEDWTGGWDTDFASETGDGFSGSIDTDWNQVSESELGDWS